MPFFHDLRIAIRTLLRRPLFTVVVVATLGLGIGASTTVYSVVHGVLFAPLPFPQGDRLVGVYRYLPRLMGSTVESVVGWYAVPFPLYLDWQARSEAFESLGAYGETGLTVTGRGEPERVLGVRVTASVFETLGIAPLRGRLLAADEDRVGLPPRVIVSEGYWVRRLGADPDVIGSNLTLNAVPHIITGVMPRTFHFPTEAAEMWVTFPDENRSSTTRDSGNLKVIARLAPGVSLAQAREDMERVRLQIAETYPIEQDFGTRVIPQGVAIAADARPGLLLLLGAVGAVLLIACANIAGLMLVRSTERRTEIGLRQALGASQGRLVLQLVAESLLLSLAGGVLGCLITAVSLRPFLALFPDGLPRATEIAVDGDALLVALALSVLVGLAISALPAFRAGRISLTDELQTSGRTHAGGRARNRAQGSLVVFEIALAFALLVGTGLFVQSYRQLMTVDPGFDPERVLTLRLSLPTQAYPSGEVARGFFGELLARLAALPGVETVASAHEMPIMPGRSFPPATVATADGMVAASLHQVSISPGYFRAMGIPVVAGRPFGPEDASGAAPVVIVNQALAARYWPGESPLGQRIRQENSGESVWRTVVGVIRDFRYELDQDPFPIAFIPFAQRPRALSYVVMKTRVPPEGLVAGARDAVRQLDPNLPVQIAVLAGRVRQSSAVAYGRFAITVLGGLAVAAGLLAFLGVYGVLAYAVTQRRREIGIRRALGAGGRTIVGDVMRRGVLLAGIGLLLGIAVTAAGLRAIESLLFEVSPTDPTALLVAAGLVLLATLGASYLPARRAARVDPMVTLRES